MPSPSLRPKARKTREPTAEELAFRAALGRRIRELRLPRYSQDEFAEEVDLFRTHVSTIEQGKTDLRLSTLLRIAAALKMPVEKLLTLSSAESGVAE